MDQCEHCREMEPTRKQIADMHRILTGNGHPEEGLVFKVAQVGAFVAFWHRFGWHVLAAIIAIPSAITTAVVIGAIGLK